MAAKQWTKAVSRVYSGEWAQGRRAKKGKQRLPRSGNSRAADRSRRTIIASVPFAVVVINNGNNNNKSYNRM